MYDAAVAQRVPVVQSLHNYRMFCPNAVFYRDGRPCEECLGRRIAWPAVLHACYRQSRLATATVAAMLAWHRFQGTWMRKVDRYVALSEFSRGKFIEGGLPGERIAVKPNFVAPDPGVADGRGGYALFAGRLSPEKGLETLLTAWKRSSDLPPLVILGDGPLAERVKQACTADPRLTWLGRQPADEVFRRLGDAACVVIPSGCYENFPRTLVEAWAKGTPAIVSRLGALAELVDEGRTGRCFEAGNPDDLAAVVQSMLSDRQGLQRMRLASRREYESKYTAEQNYPALMEIYREITCRPC